MLFLYLVLACTLSNVYGVQDCLVSTIQTQPHFHDNKFAGTWYEIEWVAPVVVKPSEFYDDYILNFTLLENGSYSVAMKFRVEPDKGTCHSKDGIWQKTDEGKYLFVRPWKDRIIHTPQWVISTDYSHYAVIYGCTSQNDDGTCRTYSSTLWSRARTLSRHFQRKAHNIFSSVCLDPNDLYQTDQNHECLWVSDVLG